MISSAALTLCLDARIFAEYDEVLSRPRFGFDPDSVAALLDYVDFNCETVASQPLTLRLPDFDDEAFLEVAFACDADCLVSGNLAHFPPDSRAGVVVLSPAAFMERYRSRGLPGEARAARGDRDKFERAMDKVRDVEPDEHDV